MWLIQHVCCHCKASLIQTKGLSRVLYIGPYIILYKPNYLQWVKAMTSSLSLRCRKWCTIWSSTCKGSITNTRPTKVKGEAKTFIMYEPYQKALKLGKFQNKLPMDGVMGIILIHLLLCSFSSFACYLYSHVRCFPVIYLSFCVFDNPIKDIIQSPDVAKVHLLPEKEQHNSILWELLRHRESSWEGQHW